MNNNPNRDPQGRFAPGPHRAAQTGRAEAQRLFSLRQCDRCGAPGTERHHRDDNPLNNHPDNIAIYCRRCHMIVDGRTAAAAERFHRQDRRGEANKQSKLTEAQVRDILERARSGAASPRSLAQECQVSISTIRAIIAGQNWAWLRSDSTSQEVQA